MACNLEVSSHWFGQGRTGTISRTANLNDIGWNDDIDAYRLKGDCSNTLVTLYQHPPPNSGWTFPVNAYETWFGNSSKGWGEHRAFKNQMSYVTFRSVPKRDYWQDMDIVGNIGDWWFHFGNDKKTEDDATAQEGFCLWGGTGDKANGSGCTRGKPCPGGSMHMINSRKVRCYYKNAPEIRELRQSINNTPSADPRKTMLSKIKEKFCADSNNIFKNPGGGTCLEYDEGKRLAKQYCQVGDRIATDANCTKGNLGNHYEELAKAYCKNNGRNNQWCSCYNVSNDVCKTHPTAAGCSKKKQVFDPLVEATPEKFRHVWSGKAKCFGSVCVGKKYVPTNANQGCDAPVQICAQSFDLDNISGSTIEAKCEQTAIQNNSSSQPSTQPSAGDSPSGPVPTPAPTPAPNQGAITNSQIPATNIDLNALTDQQKITVGLAALCLCLMFFLIIF